jgi:hypothetical protein
LAVAQCASLRREDRPVPAFIVARLSGKAKELPGTDLDHRNYSERVNALLVVALSAESAARAPDDSGRRRTAAAAGSSALALLPVPSAIL